MENDLIRNKIIDATIQSIGKYGIQSVTNRMIAKEAGVNSAAINYYFGSKEKLVDEAVKRSLDNYLAEFLKEPLEKNFEKDTQALLKPFLAQTLKDALETPCFIKSYLYEAIVHNDYSGIFIERFNGFLNHLYQNMNSKAEKIDETAIKMSIIQIISATLFISLVPDLFKDFLKVNLREPEIQEKFVELLLRHNPTAL
jgi:Transcriptional regulator